MTQTNYYEYQVWAQAQAADLPGMSYDSGTARFLVNGTKPFPTFLQAKWYYDYIYKFGSFGPELVTNGTFDTDTSGWSSDNGIVTWNAAGYLDFDRNNDPFGNHLYQSIITTVGRVYEVTYDILAISHILSLRIDDATVEEHTTTGSKSHIFVAIGTSTEIEFNGSASATATFSIDNISVRDMLMRLP